MCLFLVCMTFCNGKEWWGGLEFNQADNHRVVSGNTLPRATLKKHFPLKDSLL